MEDKELLSRIRKCHQAPDIIVLELRGGVFVSNLDSFRAAVDGAMDRRTNNMVIDFSGLDFISSMGIGYLIEQTAKANKNGRRIWITGVCPEIEKIFRQLSIDTILAIRADEQSVVDEINSLAS